MDESPLRLPVVTERSASGETAEIYEQIRAYFGVGFVPEVFQLLGTRPRLLGSLWDTYRSVFNEGTLDREVKELIAAFVAREAGCAYCAGAHQMLAELVGARAEVVAATRAASPDEMPLEEKFRALMRLVSQINRSAYGITDEDVSRLVALGWSDEELVEAIWTACVFNAVVRLVDTFGLSYVGQFQPSAPPRDATA